MGVDAVMSVDPACHLDAPALRRLSYELVAAIGPGPFWLDRVRDRHALEFDKAGFIDVNLAGRYYGEGYERGNWPDYGAIMRFFRLRLPGCTIYYGGDSDPDEPPAFTEADESRMWQHWATVQGRPYRDGFSSLNDDGIETPSCEFCRVPMVRNGWGGGFASFYCYCGLALTTRDGGFTWAEKASA